MNLFNELNCRVIQPKRYNVFFNFFANWLFIFVVLGIAAVQLIVFPILGKIANVSYNATTKSDEISVAIILGATTLLVSTFLKLTPDSWVNKIPINVDEDKGVDANDKWLSAYNK